jgi:hypothetical protein
MPTCTRVITFLIRGGPSLPLPRFPCPCTVIPSVCLLSAPPSPTHSAAYPPSCPSSFKFSAAVRSTPEPVVGFARPRNGQLEEHQVVVDGLDVREAPDAGGGLSMGLLRE